MATKARLWPDTPTHPGEVLADELEARGISVEQLSAETRLAADEIQRILGGAHPITAEFAWELERMVDGISARFWMGLQADYDLGIARLKRESH